MVIWFSYVDDNTVRGIGEVAGVNVDVATQVEPMIVYSVKAPPQQIYLVTL